MSDLADKHCAPCEGGTQPLDAQATEKHMQQLSEKWATDDAGKAIRGEFAFSNYYQTSAFVNAVVWIAHCEDHHPDITFGYKNCSIVYSTHAIGGLSDNDFICAAKIDQLLDNG